MVRNEEVLHWYYYGITISPMKTAISVPDEVFARVDRFARRNNVSRSRVFAAAAEEYVRHHQRKGITERLNELYAKESSSLDPVVSKLQSISLPQESW
jgi:metal-responsive CopG/Arc/MetJ family transcriptional regulator